jgi:hypothetical protein
LYRLHSHVKRSSGTFTRACRRTHNPANKIVLVAGIHKHT